MQNRTVQSLASSELACPPRVTPVVMQLQSEEGRNISLKCRVTGKAFNFKFILMKQSNFYKFIVEKMVVTDL